MLPYCTRSKQAAVLLAALTILTAASCHALTLLSPTEGQAVRENVKIQIPADVLPDDPETPGFISIHIGEGEEQKFVAAISRSAANETNNTLVFYWNSKASYYESSRPGKLNYFKDGVYPLTIRAHNDEGKTIDSATVEITLKNKVARTNPAPAVHLVNALRFGQMNTYKVHAEVEVYESAAGIDLPILGGLGITADFRIVQRVEDVRPDGEIMMRNRIGDNPFISSGGQKLLLYTDMNNKPQLYRLVTKYGKVIDRNLFSKQARFTIMDVLPVLPTRPVKEGDSWPTGLNIKAEGLTTISEFTGTSMLDSFEWQSGQECAKIISRLNGTMDASFADGKINAAGKADAEVTTYFAYKTGRMVKREISVEIPAIILPGAGEATGISPELAGPLRPEPPMLPNMPYDDGPSPRPGRSPYEPNYSPTTTSQPTVTKGKVRINITLRLEK